MTHIEPTMLKLVNKHTNEFYWSRMDSHARRILELVAKGIYIAREEPGSLPEAYKEKPFSRSHLLLYFAFLTHTSTAYRRLTATNFRLVQEKLEHLMWADFPHMVEFANLIREKEPTLPSTEQILQAVHKNLREEFIDFGDYAAEEFHGAGTIDTVDRLQPGQIQSHHILLASLSDCACCGFTPTPVARAFGEDMGRLYYDSRFPKAKAGEEQWVSNIIIRVAKVGDRLRAFVETGLGSFREFDSVNEYSARSRRFVPCNPPVFLKNELDLFNEILAEQGRSRERVVQEFFEQHSQFLRLLGFKGFRPQVRLRPASIDGLGQSPSLAVDFLVEQIVGKPHAVVELKQATARMTSGGNRRRPAPQFALPAPRNRKNLKLKNTAAAIPAMM